MEALQGSLHCKGHADKQEVCLGRKPTTANTFINQPFHHHLLPLSSFSFLNKWEGGQSSCTLGITGLGHLNVTSLLWWKAILKTIFNRKPCIKKIVSSTQLTWRGLYRAERWRIRWRTAPLQNSCRDEAGGPVLEERRKGQLSWPRPGPGTEGIHMAWFGTIHPDGF